MAVATELSDHEVLERIDVLHGAISAHQRDLLRYVAECDDRRRWLRDGARDMAEWLAGRLCISKWAAGRWVHAAHSLEHLPLTSEALLSGSLCLDKVLELTRFATSSSEQSLITWAQRVSTAVIRRKADLFEKVAIEDARHVESARYLRWWSFDDGKRIGLGGEFPAAHGHAITAALPPRTNPPRAPRQRPRSLLGRGLFSPAPCRCPVFDGAKLHGRGLRLRKGDGRGSYHP